MDMIVTPMTCSTTNRSINVVATQEETLKMQTDLVFATEKFEEAWAAKLNEEAEISMRDTLESTTCCGVIPENEDDENTSSEVFKWSHNAILLLIEEYRQLEKNIAKGKISQKKAWGQISAAIATHGYSVTATQCMSKWAGLKKTYKSTKDHNDKSGNSKKTWAYFDAMHDFLGSKPFMEPVVTVSSTGAITSRATATPKRGRSNSEDDDPLLPSPNRHSVYTGRRDQAEKREQARERRHAESLQRKDQALQLLERIAASLEKSDNK